MLPIAPFGSRPQIRSYDEGHRLVNPYILDRLIARPSRHLGQTETTTAELLAVDNELPLQQDKPHHRIIAAGKGV